jgi:hypothetical protein
MHSYFLSRFAIWNKPVGHQNCIFLRAIGFCVIAPPLTVRDETGTAV